jgi:hypothetical protein
VGSREGVLKVAAKRLGISLEDYLAHLEKGEKWCRKCSQWKSRDDFAADRHRSDQHQAVCRKCASYIASERNSRSKKPKTPKPVSVKVKAVRVKPVKVEPAVLNKATRPESKRLRRQRERLALVERYGANYNPGWISAAKRLGISLDEYASHINSGERWCNRCQMWRPASSFNPGSVHCSYPKERKRTRSTKGRVSTFKGHTHTDEVKKKIARLHTGNTYRLGKRHSLETRKKVSTTRRLRGIGRGESNPNYKHGNAELHHYMRRSARYKQWRYDVFMRDKFTCQHCGDNSGGNLRAHHIKGFADYPDLRFDLDNGITLCKSCHDKVHFKPDSLRNQAKARKLAKGEE